MNIWNPALVTRAFLFFSYPNNMSGSACWIHYNPAKDTLVDGFTGATPLALDSAAQYSTSFWSEFIGTIPGSVGETSTLCILLGACLLIWTGVASWKVMAGSVLGALAVGFIGDLAGVSAGLLKVPALGTHGDVQVLDRLDSGGSIDRGQRQGADMLRTADDGDGRADCGIQIRKARPVS